MSDVNDGGNIKKNVPLPPDLAPEFHNDRHIIEKPLPSFVNKQQEGSFVYLESYKGIDPQLAKEIFEHTVKKGETLHDIAAKTFKGDPNGEPSQAAIQQRVEELAKSNNLKNPDDLKVGQKISTEVWLMSDPYKEAKDLSPEQNRKIFQDAGKALGKPYDPNEHLEALYAIPPGQNEILKKISHTDNSKVDKALKDLASHGKDAGTYLGETHDRKDLTLAANPDITKTPESGSPYLRSQDKSFKSEESFEQAEVIPKGFPKPERGSTDKAKAAKDLKDLEDPKPKADNEPEPPSRTKD